MQAVLYGLVGFAVGFMQAYTPATAGSVWLMQPGSSVPSITAGNSYGPRDSIPNNTRSVTFWIAWSGNTTEQSEVEYSLVCSGSVTCTPQSGWLWMSKQMPIFDLNVTYTTGASGTGSVLLTATGPNSTQSEIQIDLPVPPPPGVVAVTPDGAQDSLPVSTTGGAADFIVANNGGTTLTNVGLTVACTPSTIIQNCSLSTSLISSLAAGATAPARVTFNTTATSGSASIKVIAQATTNTDTGSYVITVMPPAPAPPVVTAETVLRLDRANCVTAGAGPAGAYQCGDLLLAHAMPAYRTLNEDRRLTLLYNSAAATVQFALPARVTIPAGAPVPDSVNAQVRIGAQSWNFRYLGNTFATGQTRRLSLSFDASTLPSGSGLYAFELDISSYYGGSAYTAPTVAGELVVVDRKRSTDSPYGIGWTIAGLSRLFVGQSGRNALLIVEADGSFTTYDSVALNTYRAARGAFRDTVFYGTFDPGTGTSSTYYLRRGIDRSESYFDTHGRLRWQTDRRPQLTEYQYTEASNPSSPLSTIRIAPHAKALTYTFGYTSGRLDSINDPVGRKLDVTINGSGHLTGLLDPGLTQAVVLGYLANGLLTSWTSPLSHTFGYAYNENRDYLTSVSLTSPSGTLAFVPSQLTGYARAGATTAVAAGIDVTRTVVDGPRSDGDITTVYVDKWGLPTKVIDGKGDSTLIHRTFPSIPFRISRIILPNNAQSSFTYNNRGSILSVRDSTPDYPAVPVRVVEYEYGSGQNRSIPTLIRRLGDSYNDSTVITLNILGLIATETQVNGLLTRFTYDTDTIPGMLRTITQDSVLTFLPASKSKERRRHVTRFTYDEHGNLTTVKNPANFIRTYYKDAIGRDTALVNELGNRTSLTYSPYNHPLTTTMFGNASDSIASRQTTYNYNQHILQSVSDQRVAPLRSYVTDGWDRVVREVDDYSNADSTVYDASGNLVQFRPRAYQLASSPFITMRYDSLNRPRAKVWPARSVPGDSVIYDYDNMSRLVAAASGNDTITRQYYADGMLKQEVQKHGPNASTHRYVYDRFMRRKEYHVGAPAGEQDHFYYSYSPDGRRMKIEAHWRNLTTRDSVILQFDELGRRDSVHYFVYGQQKTSVGYGYDFAGGLRWVCAKHLDANGTYVDLLNFKWFAETVDSAGRPTAIDAQTAPECTASSDLVFSRSNAFDGYGHLKSQTTNSRRTEFRYDASGNMVARQSFFADSTNFRRYEYHIDAGHNTLDYFSSRYTTHTERRLDVAYDLSQSRVVEAPASPSPDSAFFHQRLYYYDGLQRMTGTFHYELSQAAVSFPWELWHREWTSPTNGRWDTSIHNVVDGRIIVSDSINLPAACRYDPVGRMWDPCDNSTGSLRSFDGPNVVRTGDDRSNSALTRFTFLHGSGVDDPLLGHKAGASGETVIYITNGMGELFAIAQATGFDSYNRLSDDNPSAAGGIRNAGSFENHTAGAFSASLSYYRNRFYDAETARWTQEDPLGFSGGGNLIAYAGNNPAAATDAFGLCPDKQGKCWDQIRYDPVEGTARKRDPRLNYGPLIDMSRSNISNTSIPSLGSVVGSIVAFAQCTGQEAWNNLQLTHLGIAADPTVKWALRGARAALGTQYVATSGAPGALKYLGGTRSFFLREGLRSGTILRGSEAARLVGVEAIKAAAAGAIAFEAGVAIGSLAVGAIGCIGGAN